MDKGKIITGLAIFLVLVTAPIWYGFISGQAGAAPTLEMPPPAEEGGKPPELCIEDKETMRRDHMQILMVWRDEVVRGEGGDRTYKSPTSKLGMPVQKSLTLTCVKCHSNKDKFCDRCHEYLKVKPYCWDCHITPGGSI